MGLSVSQDDRWTRTHARRRSLPVSRMRSSTLMTLLCVCLQMANLVTSLCCVVLAAVVVAYAQRRSQLGEYAFLSSLCRRPTSTLSPPPISDQDCVPLFLFTILLSTVLFYWIIPALLHSSLSLFNLSCIHFAFLLINGFYCFDAY